MRTQTLLEHRAETVESILEKVGSDDEATERIRALLGGGAFEREVGILSLIETLLALQGRVEELESSAKPRSSGARRSQSKSKSTK